MKKYRQNAADVRIASVQAMHATRDVIDALETHIFNWIVYPRFSELKNEHGSVIEYREIRQEKEFGVRHLKMRPVAVNHKVPSSGYIVRDGRSVVAITGDTAEMDGFWNVVNSLDELDAVLIECAFPDEFDELSAISHHLTPSKLALELKKFDRRGCPVFVINIKPSYRTKVCDQLAALNQGVLKILEVGREYTF